MTTANKLIDLISRACEEQKVLRVSFDDADIYDLRILSAMHAQEGADIVAEIVGIVRVGARRNFLVTGTSINFRLREVLKVEANTDCLFSTEEPIQPPQTIRTFGPHV